LKKKGLGFFSNDKGDMEAGKTVVAMCGSLLAGGLRFFFTLESPRKQGVHECQCHLVCA